MHTAWFSGKAAFKRPSAALAKLRAASRILLASLVSANRAASMGRPLANSDMLDELWEAEKTQIRNEFL